MIQWQGIFVVFLLLQMCHNSNCLPKRTIVFLGFSNCADTENIPVHFNGSLTYIKRNKYFVEGDLNFKETLSSPMEVLVFRRCLVHLTNIQYIFQFQAIAQRCNMDRSQCEHFNTFLLPNICNVFDQKNKVWSEIMAHAQPKLKCPVKDRIVRIVNATIDYSILAHLPLDGYIWIVYMKIFKPLANVRHKKRLILCTISEYNITKSNESMLKRKPNSTDIPCMSQKPCHN